MGERTRGPLEAGVDEDQPDCGAESDVLEFWETLLI